MNSRRLTLALAALVLAACSDSPTEAGPAIPGSTETLDIAPNPVHVGVGEIVALRLTGLGPNLLVVWSSDDPSVADVAAGGFVRGINPGATTITAKAAAFSASALVIVSAPESLR